MMTESEFFDVLRQGIWLTAQMSAPMLGAALIAGTVIGLLQALTSVQEMTLTFLPKAALILAVFWVSMTTMTQALLAYFTGAILPLVGAH